MAVSYTHLTGHLEVHLAVEVLHTLDVDEGGEAAVIVLDQAAGDAGHGLSLIHISPPLRHDLPVGGTGRGCGQPD